MKIIDLKYSFMITDDHLEACPLTMQPWLIGCIKVQHSKMMTKNVVYTNILWVSVYMYTKCI